MYWRRYLGIFQVILCASDCYGEMEWLWEAESREFVKKEAVRIKKKNKFTELPLRDAETKTARECFFPGFRSVPNGEPNASCAGFGEVREQNEPPKA